MHGQFLKRFIIVNAAAARAFKVLCNNTKAKKMPQLAREKLQQVISSNGLIDKGEEEWP